MKHAPGAPVDTAKRAALIGAVPPIAGGRGRWRNVMLKHNLRLTDYSLPTTAYQIAKERMRAGCVFEALPLLGLEDGSYQSIVNMSTLVLGHLGKFLRSDVER